MKAHERIFCAVDTGNIEQARALIATLVEAPGGPVIGGIKLGLEFFVAHGPAGIRAVARDGVPVFLDLKLHDIPNTVAGAVRSALEQLSRLNLALMTVHASGGPAMIRAAADMLYEAGSSTKPVLLGVTVLTSLDKADLAATGQADDVTHQVMRLGRLALENGAGGVVAAPFEVGFLKRGLAQDFVAVVPGVRPGWAGHDDQKRFMTPAEAIGHGADYLVIGRPITAAPDPVEAARRIVEEIASAAAADD